MRLTRIHRWAAFSLSALLVALATPRAVRALGGSVAVGATPVLVGEVVLGVALAAAAVAAVRTVLEWRSLSIRDRLMGVLPLALTGIAVAGAVAFHFAGPM